MDSRIRPWIPRLLFVSVVAILALVGIIQYQWFSRSAAVEIDSTVRGLESGIRQAVSREFQRFAVVFTELDALRAPKAPNDAELRVLLDRLWSTYGPDGTVSSLLSSVAYGVPGQGLFRKTADTGWTQVDWQSEGDPVPSDKGGTAALRVNGQDYVMYSPSRKLGATSVLIGLDIDDFFRKYVVTSLAELYPGALLAWTPSFQGPPEGPGFDSSTYAFNPFTALVTGSSLPRTMSVAIPRPLDQPGRFQRTFTRAAAPVLPSMGPSTASIALVTGPVLTAVRANEWSISVTLPAEAPVLDVERRLAWNWLGSSLLLVVLAAAFGLILRQSGRLAELRRREREFVASVSHELRTPLTVIRSAADNFTRGIVAPERLGKYGQLILDQSIRLGRMIEEMLAFAQTESTNAAPVKALLRFEDWLLELRPPLEALAAEKHIHLAWDVAGVPPEGLTDPDALRLILDNLVVNALNHAYPAPVPEHAAVRVSLRHLLPDRLELLVEDDGRGISAKEAKRVFEPFYRDQVSRNNQEKGSGLGLFLAQHRAKRLGGSLTLESPWRGLDGAKRSGCRFVVVVPFEEVADHGR